MPTDELQMLTKCSILNDMAYANINIYYQVENVSGKKPI